MSRAVRLLLVVVLAAPCAADGPAPGPPALRPATRKTVESLVEPWIASEHLVGVVVGVVDGARAGRFAFGRLAPGDARAPAADTVFEIGSISKVLTGLLLARAAHDEGLALGDSVQAHVPEGVTVPAKGERAMTLLDLATHRSGLPRMPDNLDPADPLDPYADYGEEALFAFLDRHALRRAPGAAHEYSNLGAGLLGHLLARDAGGYAALLREAITAPLGMDDTGLALTEAQTARFAPPHRADTTRATPWTFDALAGAGAVRSTLDDMLRFVRLHIDPPDTPLGRAATTALAVHHQREEGAPAMGLGWHVGLDGHRWHNGQTAGYHAFVGLHTDAKQAVVVLSNTATGIVDQIGNGVLRHLAGGAVAPPDVPPVPAVAPAVLDRYVGTYDLAGMARVTVRRDGARLLVRLTGQPELRVFPTSQTEFVYRVVEARLVFEEDALVLHQHGREMRATRAQ